MSGSVFVCTVCAMRTTLFVVAENHERRTDHEVWEVPA